MGNILKPFCIVLVMVVVSGCASGVTRSGDTAKREAYFAGGGKVAQDVTIVLSKEAQAKIIDNLKFDQDRLLATVRRALDAKGLLSKGGDASLPRIEIYITDLRVRSNFAAIMFGFMAGDDSVTGDIVARDPSGKELQRFTVSASYALGGLAGGQDDARMGWLYETFAQHTVEELTGTVAK